MKKGNQPDLCPLCGAVKKPATTTAQAAGRAAVAVVSTAQEAIGAKSSDDQTANDFAAFLLKTRSREVEGK